MRSEPTPVESHYTVNDLGQRILDALAQMGKDIDRLAPEDLALVDEFHIRGREATQELAQRAELDPTMKVLDVGCGIGGSARFLAHEYGCHVVGVDMTRAYCEVAATLSDRLGLSSQTKFLQGNALDLPFEAAGFDAVWTEHTQMNIEDKTRFYGEIWRVLKPGGRLLFHDIFEGPGGDLRFPVPWASEPGLSFLARPDDVKDTLTGLGFDILYWEEMNQVSLAWFRNAVAKAKADGPSPLGLHLLMGEDAPAKFQNMLTNLERNSIAVVQCIAEKKAEGTL